MRQILFNLVGNAIKFTEVGEVRVEAALLPVSKEPFRRALVTVSDTGIGISDEKAGYLVSTAKDGQEALQVLAKEDVDVILMDIQMPVMDGVEAARAIRGGDLLGAKANVPIIAMIAYTMTGDREKFLASGMDGYIAKPIDRAELVEVIERVMAASVRPELALSGAIGRKMRGNTY